jgi:tetratricopeptide (TPR) repeat protein
LILSESDDADRNARFLAELLDARLPREQQRGDATGIDEQSPPNETIADRYLAAFRNRGIELNMADGNYQECAGRLAVLPESLRPEVIAALDDLWIKLLANDAADERWRDLALVSYELDQDVRLKTLRDIIVVRLTGHLEDPEQGSLKAEAERLPDYAKYLNVASESVGRIVALVRTMRLVRQEEAALALLRRAVNSRPDEVLLLSELAEWLERMEPPRWNEAVEYRRALRSIRQDSGLALADGLLNDGRPQEAESVLRDLIRRHPDRPDWYVSLGVCLSHVPDRVAEEEAAYREAIRINPELKSAHRLLGSLLDATGRHEAAKVHFQRAKSNQE